MNPCWNCRMLYQHDWNSTMILTWGWISNIKFQQRGINLSWPITWVMIKLNSNLSTNCAIVAKQVKNVKFNMCQCWLREVISNVLIPTHSYYFISHMSYHLVKWMSWNWSVDVNRSYLNVLFMFNSIVHI